MPLILFRFGSVSPRLQSDISRGIFEENSLRRQRGGNILGIRGLPRLRSGFRLRAQTPARRLNFDARSSRIPAPARAKAVRSGTRSPGLALAQDDKLLTEYRFEANSLRSPSTKGEGWAALPPKLSAEALSAGLKPGQNKSQGRHIKLMPVMAPPACTPCPVTHHISLKFK